MPDIYEQIKEELHEDWEAKGEPGPREREKIEREILEWTPEDEEWLSRLFDRVPWERGR